MNRNESSTGYDVVIIGSGLGGLLCGAILSRNGHRVCILEKHHKAGGNLQTFSRNGIEFNSAMHYVGAMDPGQILHRVFRYLGVIDRTGLEKLDEDQYEMVYLGDRLFAHANGMEAHRERLLSYFPGEQKAIDTYLKTIQEVWDSTNVLNLMDFRNLYDADTRYTQINAYDFIDRLTDNEELKSLWGVTSALYAGIPDRSPLITHAIINYHYIQSAYKFSRGSGRLALALCDVIRANGGEVIMNREVTAFEYREKEASAVLCRNGSRYEASSFISNIHPARLVDMVEPGRFRKAYVTRIKELENTIGSFCVYLELNPGRFRNINSNVFISSTRKVWNAGMYDQLEWPAACMLYTTPSGKDPEYAESLTVSAFMKYDEVKAWEDTTVEKRGDDYRAFKRDRAEALISLVASRYPGLRAVIAAYYTATPLTFRDYTGIPEGSVYGILKDCNNPRRSYISPNTRIPNLFLTGQNSGVGLHGVLGVTVSALFTCANFIDIGNLLQTIRNG
jgi:all-trans-retinol 13,14-reductase